MLTAGDEFGRTQHGNNNAYAQDNRLSWLDWAGRDRDLEDFACALVGDPQTIAGAEGWRVPDGRGGGLRLS